MTLPAPFHNTAEYRAAFVRGLDQMLNQQELGAFILVLANAVFDPQIHQLLRHHLDARCCELADALRAELCDGRPMEHHADDLLVFLKLLAVGLDRLEDSRMRRLGPWELQYNQLRSFRPPRMSRAGFSGLHQPFDADGFHFNKPFLAREICWEGELAGQHCRLLYNKFPFAPLHGVLVIRPERCAPQFIERSDHLLVWRLLELMGEGIPGVGLGYNSLGANASVNHQHFQLFVREQEPLPIELHQWRHCGGGIEYPIPVTCHTDPERAWSAIEALHRCEQSYNLIYRPGRLYLLARVAQGSVNTAAWAAGVAWSELAGSVVVSNLAQFRGIDAAQLEQELGRLRTV